MKMKKIIALALSAVMTAGILAGCGTKEDKPSSTTTPESNVSNVETPDVGSTELEGTLKVSTWDLETQMAYVQTLADEFMKQNPKVKVEIMDTPADDYNTKLMTNLSGGAAADVIIVKELSELYNYNKSNHFLDLSSYIEKDNIDLSAFSGLAEGLKFDSVQAALPFRTDHYVLYYNKDIFDAANVEYPTNDMTWAEFEDLAKKVTSGEGASKVYGAHLHTWQACVQNWAIQDGENTIMGPDYDFMKDAYDMALRMQNDDKTIADYSTLKTSKIHYRSAFETGTAAMVPMGTWFIQTLIADANNGDHNINWGVATIPHPENVEAGYTVGSTTPLAINAKTANADLAWEFVKFCTTEEGVDILADAGQFPAGMTDEILARIVALDGMPEGLSEALQVKNISLDRPVVEFVSDVNKMVGEVHDNIMIGEETVEDGLAAMKTRSAEIQGG